MKVENYLSFDYMDNSVSKQMYIVKAKCWKCDTAINVALIKPGTEAANSNVYGPEAF